MKIMGCCWWERGWQPLVVGCRLFVIAKKNCSPLPTPNSLLPLERASRLGLFVIIRDCRRDSPLQSLFRIERASRLGLFVIIRDCRSDSPLQYLLPTPD